MICSIVIIPILNYWWRIILCVGKLHFYVLQAHDERNYHIFYCMIQGLSADQLNQLELKDATSYYYLTQVYYTVTANFLLSYK